MIVVTCERVCQPRLDSEVHQLGGSVLGEHLHQVGGV